MIRFAVTGMVLAATAASTIAQDITLTSSAQNLNVALTGYVQGEGTDTIANVQRVRITTKDLVGMLEGSSRARLMLITPVDYEGDVAVVLREPGTRNQPGEEFDVTDVFYSETYAVVEKSRVKNDRVTGTQYSIDRFTFGGDWEGAPEAWYDLQGYTTSNLSNGAFNSTVNGVGWVGSDAVMTGKISATGGKLETFVIPDPDWTDDEDNGDDW
jgi:hypothetical protein